MEFDLLEDCFFNVHLLELILNEAFIDLIVFFQDFQVLVILWVFMGIMAKVETFGLLYHTPEPFREVCIADAPLLLLVLVYDKLGKVLIIQVFPLEDTEYILYGDIAIIV